MTLPTQIKEILMVAPIQIEASLMLILRQQYPQMFITIIAVGVINIEDDTTLFLAFSLISSEFV